MPIDEDLSRYAAPPDNLPEERTYNSTYIRLYLESWMLGPPSVRYTIDQVREILRDAADNITDEDHGIETI